MRGDCVTTGCPGSCPGGTRTRTAVGTIAAIQAASAGWPALVSSTATAQMGWGAQALASALSGSCACARCHSACSAWGSASVRSEEHTSELQSHSDLVCRLLLDKKINKMVT